MTSIIKIFEMQNAVSFVILQRRGKKSKVLDINNYVRKYPIITRHFARGQLRKSLRQFSKGSFEE